MEHIVFIGNGISAITAARHIRKRSNYRITVISDETDHFYARTALMYVFMGHMRYKDLKPYEDNFWKKNNIDLIRDRVTYIDTDNKQLFCDVNNPVKYDKLVIATGSVPKKIKWPGIDLNGVQGLYHYSDIETMDDLSGGIERAIIAGGGLIGIEMAEMLHARGIPVTILVREKTYWGSVLPYEEGKMVTKHIRENHIDVKLETELKEIIGDKNGYAKSVITNHDEEIPCQFVGIAIGVTPNVSFLKDSGIETDKGVLINEYFQTNIDDVFSIGDCAQHRTPPPNRKPVEQVWYTGRMMGETLALTLTGEKTAYNPGIWFNSAKFLDVEYQNYGWVFPNPKENESSFYWENPMDKKCLRLVYDKNTKALTGINVFGIRLNHCVCDEWINNQVPVNEVVTNLNKANFDPEFFKNYQPQIREHFNKHVL
jgi:NAD(P)H-nitrite reductase large subunit